MRTRSPSAILALGVVLLMSLLVSACDGDGSEGPRARAGVIDLSAWDFAGGGVVDLAGEWGFGWGADPSDAFRGRADAFIVQPGVWNRAAGPVRPPSGQGRAILSLSVLLPAEHPLLALAIPDINSAYRLHLNGRPTLAVGVVGDDERGEVPVYQRPLIPVPAGERRLDIVIEVSNHHHFEGGIGRAIRLGSRDHMHGEFQRRMVVPLFALGALAVVFLMQLGFYVGGHRERAFLIFAAFTALVAVRTFSSGQVYSLADAALRADVWYLLPSYLTLFTFPGIYLLFLRELFPVEVPRRLAAPVVALSALAVAAALLLPPAVYTRLRDPFQALVLVMPLIGSGILGLAVWRRRPGACWMLAGSTAFLATVANDSLHYQRIIQSVDLSSLGFTAFAVAYAAALALRLFRSERDASARLATMNRALEDKVAERTESLARAKAEAERASQAKSEFLAVMSHEIRTPIHGWAGLTELLAQTPLTEQQRGYVAQLRLTADHLGMLLGDILDMARIEAGRLTVERMPFDLPHLIDELAASGRTSAGARGLAFSAEGADGVPQTVLGDVSVVRRIVLSFLDNAVKFTRQGQIRLRVAPTDAGMIRFSVGDTGCGIPPERQSEVFTAFTQLDPSSGHGHGGSGLGLALSRRLADLAGGSVGVESAPGVGSTFWCDLPLATTRAAPAGGGDDGRLAPPPGTRVLIADDVALNRLVLRGFLAGGGCEVDEAADGREAVTKVGRGTYDLIVLDLRMPGLDGFQAARAIRGHEERKGLARVPLAALSAGAAAEDRQRALEAGFDVFLGKPIERADLLAELAHLLPRRPIGPTTPPPMPPEGLEDLVPMFVAEMERDTIALRTLKDGDRAGLAEFAHAMRGKAGMFGEEQIYQLTGWLESDGPDASQQEIDEIVARVVERAGQLKVYEAGLPPVAP